MKFQHLALVLLALSGAAEANLIDRGNGMIYDQDLNLTWIQNTDISYFMTWDQANAWATDLSYGGYSDWRLPTTPDANSSYGYNQTSSEMGHLFYHELGGLAGHTLSSTHNANYGLFRFRDSTLNYAYWSGTESAADPNFAWYFSTVTGIQYDNTKDKEYLAWAVRTGDVAVVPVPAAVWLLGSGLLGLLGLRRQGNIG
ncbi:MAG: DUF1566 domain-containing protein [Methylococcales bacterium]